MAIAPASWAWWDASWNAVSGCKAVSPGCTNCYAARWAATFPLKTSLHEGTTDWVRGKAAFNGMLSVLPPGDSNWTWPLRWRGADRPRLGEGQPSLIFVSPMSDLFHEDRPKEIIDQVLATITASRHIGLLLTKRAERMAKHFTAMPEKPLQCMRRKVWLGFSAERQQEFDARWPYMRQLAADGFIVFVSVAPMLRSVALPPDFLAYGERIWCIASGEEGGERPMHPDWPRALRDQCADAGVPFFMLQMAGRKPIPADLFVRQFPRPIIDEVCPTKGPRPAPRGAEPK